MTSQTRPSDLDANFRNNFRDSLAFEFEKSTQARWGLRWLVPIATSLFLVGILAYQLLNLELSSPTPARSTYESWQIIDQQINDLHGFVENDQEFNQALEQL